MNLLKFGVRSRGARIEGDRSGALRLELHRLRRQHPQLSRATARWYGRMGAVALARSGHSSGVCIDWSMAGGNPRRGQLAWRCTPAAVHDLDDKSVTEQGAEAVSLAWVSAAHGWAVERRMQEGERGDWMLRDPSGQSVALEVSGTRGGDSTARLREKLLQVQGASATRKAVCVVAFNQPQGRMEVV
jgi:hypothetical protein